MQERPGTKYVGTERLANNTVRQRYAGPFNDDQAVIIISFYQGKMFAVSVFHFLGADQVMDKFNQLKAGMTKRYGAPFKESGQADLGHLLSSRGSDKDFQGPRLSAAGKKTCPAARG